MAKKSKKLLVFKTKKDMLDILSNWKKLHANLTRIGEEDLKKMINLEVKCNKRSQIVIRLHTRYNRLRVERERTEYLSKLM